MDSRFKGGYNRMTGCTMVNHPEYDRGFRNGQQSKQAEIDALKMTSHNLSVQVIDAEAYSDHWEKNHNRLQAEIKKAVLSLRNEFNLWADDTEQFHAIEAQIEQLEELLK